MSLQIIKKNQQARGQFNGGEILENKPIGFPREGGHLRPYSNLFYWAHAWSEGGSTIPLHPHQGFEIMSFVLKGSIEHFDTKLNRWITLEKGAAQIIRAGNGISHSERINEGSHMFQIWFDPNLNVTMNQDATYDDYSMDEFPLKEEEGVSTLVYKGDGSPLQMDAEVNAIEVKEIEKGTHVFELDSDLYHSFYLIEGALSISEQSIESNDFFIVSEQDNIEINVHSSAMLFKISSPLKLNYRTYSERLTEAIQ